MPPVSPRLSPAMQVVVTAVRKAGRRLLRDFGEVEQLQVSVKGPSDFASTADLRAEQTLKEELSKARPNFAFLMAEGIHREVSALPWVSRVTVRLHDHMFAEQVNEGVNGGRRFRDIFRELSDGADLDELRAKFDEKAFQRRQEVVLLSVTVVLKRRARGAHAAESTIASCF